MNYQKVISMLNRLAGGIDRMIGNELLPPGRDDYE